MKLSKTLASRPRPGKGWEYTEPESAYVGTGWAYVKPLEPYWCVRDWMGVCEAVGTKPVYVRLDERMQDWNRRT